MKFGKAESLYPLKYKNKLIKWQKSVPDPKIQKSRTVNCVTEAY